MDLTEAKDIKKRWQEYTEELYKKDLHDPDNQRKTYCLVQVASEPFRGTDLKPESSRNTQALNIAEDQHFLRKKRIA